MTTRSIGAGPTTSGSAPRSQRHAARDVLVFSLHDCYAPAWLPHYPRLLSVLHDLGELKTLDQLAAEVTLASAV